MTDIAMHAAPAPSAWAKEARACLALGWPLVLTNLAQIAISTTDVAILGRLGPNALAAGALGATLSFALLVLGMGLAMATSPMLAQDFGRRRSAVREPRRTVRQGLWATLGLSLASWALLGSTEEILLALGQEAKVARGAGRYLDGFMWGMLPALWFMVLRSFISALERPRAGLVVTLVAVALNAGLCWGLALGAFGLPALGLFGAGLAGSLANLALFLGLAGFVLADRRMRRFHLFGRFWRPDWPRLAELLRIGLPMSFAFGFEVTVFSAAAFMMGLIGPDPLAAHAVALQIASIAFMVPLGLSQAATVRVGLAVGAGDREAAGRAGWVALGLGSACMAASAALMLLAPGPLVDLFIDPADPAGLPVRELALSFISVAALFQLVDGAQAVGAGALRGLKDARTPMLFAGFGYWGIGVPLSALLAFGAGLDGFGVWLGLAAALAVVAALMVSRWTRREALGLV